MPGRRGALTLAVAACALTLIGGSTARAGPTTPLGNEGRWVTDAGGRVVILHGVNMVYKVPPYHPGAAGFGADDARFLAENGFNTVRLGLIYAGVEPSPGAYDEAYLDQIAAVEATLAQHGIFSQLDFHQDMYNERFQGEGWPDWAVQDDGLPAVPQTGFPTNYVLMPALQRAFDHFWANDPGPGGVGLQDRYAAAFRRVAERFRDRQHTIGYDIVNEPWPGTPYGTCLSPLGCPAFDLGVMEPFYRRVGTQIRQVEPQKLIWEEPNVIFNFGADSSLPGTDPRSGFSFHVYCVAGALSLPAVPGLACPELEELVFDNADKQAAETGQALLLSEFGATDDLSVVRRNVRDAERHMVSWQYWHYCECLDPTTTGSGTQAVVVDPSQPPTGSNVKAQKLDLLSQPYPQVVAGTPERFAYDEAAQRFELAYSTTAPNGANLAGRLEQPAKKRAKRKGKRKRKSAATAAAIESKKRKKRKRKKGGAGGPRVAADSPQTEIFVGPRHYPSGYEVELDGAGIASAPSAPILRVIACPGTARVRVAVHRAGHGVANGPDCLIAGAAKPRLRVRVRPKRATAGERTCFRVTVTTEGGGPLAGSRVRFKGAKGAGNTGTDGTARVCTTFPEPGSYRLRAGKTGYKGARARIRVGRG